jgi:hypothetical protein|tara:strand:+ start:2622 stop:2792 length:171 start_codon:yes stop_codon:yes gene_type:complete
MGDKKPAKIKALVELEFDALTSNEDDITVMIREKFHRAMRNKIIIKDLFVSDPGDF